MPTLAPLRAGLPPYLIGMRSEYLRQLWHRKNEDLQKLAAKLNIAFPSLHDDIEYVRAKAQDILQTWRETFKVRAEMGTRDWAGSKMASEFIG